MVVVSKPKKNDSEAVPRPQGRDILINRLCERGSFSLSDVELLSVLLRKSAGTASSALFARELLKKAGNSLVRLSKMSIGRLEKIEGGSLAQAVVMIAAWELGRRIQNEENTYKNAFVDEPADIQRIVRPYLRGIPHEECWILLLNQKARLLGLRQVSQGGLMGASMDTSAIFRLALSEPDCTNFVVVHNHTSGNCKPSPQDTLFTKKVAAAALLIGISLRDHVIYTDESVYSFYKEDKASLSPSKSTHNK